MRRPIPFTLLLGCATFLGGTGCGGSSASTLPAAVSAAQPLINSVMGAIPGLSQAQAILGAGSMLGLAKAKMPAGDWSQLAGAVPGADALVGQAVSQGAPSAPSDVGAVGRFLASKGLPPNSASQLVPVLNQSIGGKLSADVAGALAAALK